jgi:sulfite exporter TauE/SafE
MGSVEGAALYMLVFGLGTFPMMLAAAFFGKMLSQKFKQRVWNLAPKMVAVVGILFILRGMNLGIPYVSPMLVSKAGITTCMGNTEAIEFVDIVED